MPITDGPKILEMIRTEIGTSDLPVFFLTGKSDKESVAKVLKLRPQGYILKTAGRQEVLQQIEDYFIKSKG